MSFTIDVMNQVHDKLSTLQALPLVGPIIFSPIKGVVGISQAVVSCALGALFVLASILTCGQIDALKNGAAISLAHVVLGMSAAGYALLNIATLGIAGCIFSDLYK